MDANEILCKSLMETFKLHIEHSARNTAAQRVNADALADARRVAVEKCAPR
ncbi:MAG TPA: hypothetical protein VHB27_11990 [Rhodopila sp.]|uniref:hypothetical protein n=1 Tax=Rhodopila sp. TaxID=2480087 RepID=UPI002BEEC7CB|nr:hypothetical protein [Rhodopila sp.]HVY15941.1 hypothetical protein [Rhodopila sp.]